MLTYPFISTLTLLAVGLYQILSGDIIPVGYGWGFDGQHYGPMSLDFLEQWPQTRTYFKFRALPSILVHFGHRFLNIPLTMDSVIRGHQVLNLGMIVTANFGWLLICRHVNISERGRWLGFFGLFINFSILKGYFFEPILTDVPGFAMSIFAFYFYLRDNRPALWGLLFLSIFTWQILFLVIALFITFPISDSTTSRTNSTLSRKLFPLLISLSIALIINCHFEYLHNPVYTLGVLCTILYLFFSLNQFSQKCPVPKGAWPVIKFRILLLALITIGALLSSRNFPQGTLVASIIRPLNFLLSHIVWFGPIIFVIIAFWSSICKKITDYGPAPYFIILTGLLLSVTARSRHLLPFYILFIFFTVLTVEKIKFSRLIIIYFIVLSLVSSKFWWTMNLGPWTEPFAYTAQVYWMTFGKHVSDHFYMVQGIIVCLSAAIFLELLKLNSRAQITSKKQTS